MSQPLASIIIPCYNAERFLAETLESVFAQTFPNLEIVLIDDGSTDGTPEIIKSFGTKVHAEFGPNRGVSAARNRGTELASGDYIQYLDADDLLLPDAIAKRVQALEADGADVAYSDWQKLILTEKGDYRLSQIEVRRIEDVSESTDIALFTSFWSPPAAMLYRRTTVDAINGWNTSLPVIQDARFALDAALMGARFVHVPGVGAYYRVHGGVSLSRRDPLAFIRDVYVNAIQVEDWWKGHGGLTAERRLALAQVYNYTARTFFLEAPAIFNENLQRLYAVCPGFQCSWPKVAGLMMRLIGRQNTAFIMNKLSLALR